MYISDFSTVDPPNKVVPRKTLMKKTLRLQKGQRIVCEADVGKQGD